MLYARATPANLILLLSLLHMQNPSCGVGHIGGCIGVAYGVIFELCGVVTCVDL